MIIDPRVKSVAYECSMRGLNQASIWLLDLCTEDYPTTVNLPSAIYLKAKSLFDCHEYVRAYELLKNQTDSISLFLGLYSSEDGERLKEEKVPDLLERPGQSPVPVNEYLLEIEHSLSQIQEKDSFMLYLNGVIAKNLGFNSKAISCHISAVNEEPFLWQSWIELAALIPSIEQYHEIGNNLPDCPCKSFFEAHLLLELSMNQEAFDSYQSLSQWIPSSHYIQSKMAVALYNTKNFDEAEKAFEQVMELDPFCLDNLDVYSNILYVQEDRPKLAELAQRCSQIDHYRPETCCIIGNYYSLRSDHENAIKYFQRALKLDRSYLSAWTLMGHEYVELKNTSAAVESYRRAVDINPKDYRAWYGLGQTYEVLRLPLYALHYYQKAAEQRPTDARMWCAIGGCYETLKQPKEAIAAYLKATNDDQEGLASIKLARLYLNVGDKPNAAIHYRNHLEINEDYETIEVAESCLFLANYSKEIKNFKDAKLFASKLLHYGGSEKEEAKALLREIHNQ